MSLLRINKFKLEFSGGVSYQFTDLVGDVEPNNKRAEYRKRSSLNSSYLTKKGNFQEWDFFIYRTTQTDQEWADIIAGLAPFNGKGSILWTPDTVDNSDKVYNIYFWSNEDLVNDYDIEKIKIKVIRMYSVGNEAIVFPALFNLVHYWNCDVDGVYDDARGNITGSKVGKGEIVPGKNINAYEFTATGNIDCTPTTGLNGEKCISFWINGNKPTGNEYVFFDGLSFIGIRFISTLIFGKTGGTYDGYTLDNWVDGAWNLIAMNFDATGELSEVRINNVAEAQSSTDLEAGGLNFKIGSYDDETLRLNRDLDELAIWNRNLTSDELDTLWNDESGIFY